MELTHYQIKKINELYHFQIGVLPKANFTAYQFGFTDALRVLGVDLNQVLTQNNLEEVFKND